jgi:hypothetical protein
VEGTLYVRKAENVQAFRPSMILELGEGKATICEGKRRNSRHLNESVRSKTASNKSISRTLRLKSTALAIFSKEVDVCIMLKSLKVQPLQPAFLRGKSLVI